MERALYKTKIASLLLFVFALPFSYWDPLGIASMFSITKAFGFMYAIFAFLTFKSSFERGITLPVVRLLLFIWILMAIQSLVHWWYNTRFSIMEFSLIQNILLFWLISSDIIRNKKIIKFIFLAIVLGVALMVALSSFGIGISLEMELGEQRLSFFGANSNNIAVFLSLALILIIYLSYKKKFGKKSYLLLFLVLPILSMIGMTGSRSALILVGLSLLCFFLFFKTKIWKKIILLSFGTLFVGYSLEKIVSSEIMAKRIEKTMHSQELGPRGEIWSSAFNIFLEKPVLGWGQTGYEKQIMNNFNGIYWDTHNLFLYLMVTTGIIGITIFIFFLFRLIKNSWIYYKINADPIMLVILLFYLTNISKTGAVINNNTMWVLAAIIFSSVYFYQSGIDIDND
ncbi:O-antigen ligase family protein [Christiangramia sp. SM2212]|uniref:O-antigen ligase family protein n=1 Tax=Christiangramia sediminicola TaxID=3073267 RepID=A0ABU1ELS3_9FLAO|nr:O-antigen ligase family protein [Christiangramia sp. SM2212]MDR5589336.1 O-antigen ligase family protein [Christiangramia sp. SM2212]